MTLFPAVVAIAVGLFLLLWSADRFVEGASATAKLLGMPPLLIGMLVIGFGTSAPEMVVSAFASLQGNPGIAVGNAYGSNITNLALILGVTGLIAPITVHSKILKRELPILTLLTLIAAVQLLDSKVSHLDAAVLLGLFALVMTWTVIQSNKDKQDALVDEIEQELESKSMSASTAAAWLFIGFVLLVVSSRMLVWGAVEVAEWLGVNDLVIGLTVVAIGTSLPELASTVAASRKGEHDLALGNLLGSNMFNTLAVVGIAGAICEVDVPPEVIQRDVPAMALLTISIFFIGYGFRGLGRINRLESALLVLAYVIYNAYLVYTVVGKQ